MDSQEYGKWSGGLEHNGGVARLVSRMAEVAANSFRSWMQLGTMGVRKSYQPE